MARSNSREQFLRTTARLLRERGYAATGINEVISASGAPKGSLYFHFPGGKEEVASLALEAAGDEMCIAIRAVLFNSKTVREGIRQVFAMIIAELEQTDFRAGCPMGTVAAESPDAPRVVESVNRVFGQWQSLIKDRLAQTGLRPRRAEELAEFVLAQFEGSLVLAKARRTSKPLLSAVREIVHHLEQDGVR